MKKKLRTALLIMIMIISTTSQSEAGVYHDSGTNASIAVADSGRTIEVHETDGITMGLYFNTGTAEGDQVNWDDGIDSGHQYDKGLNPDIAVSPNGRYVVEVHETSNVLSNDLYYNVGTFDEHGNFSWIRAKNNGTAYDTGRTPVVAVNNDGEIVEVHKQQSGNNLYFNKGQILDDGTIYWDKGSFNGTFFDTGLNPDVAMNSAGEVVEVHETTGSDHKLYFNRATIDRYSKELIWHEGNDSGTFYDYGSDPSVALDAEGLVVEVHETSHIGGGDLMNNIGVLLDEGIYWYSLSDKDQKAPVYDSGQNPVVALNNNHDLVEIHQGSSSFSSKLYTGAVKLEETSVTALALYDGINNGVNYDTGNYPNVDMNDNGTILELHSDLVVLSGQQMYFNGGILKDDGSIDWFKGNDKGTFFGIGAGPYPSITNDGMILETHTESKDTKLYYTIGEIDADRRTVDLDSENSIYYGRGEYQNAILLEDGRVVEVHSYDNKIYFNIGTLNKLNKTIVWEKPDELDQNRTVDTFAVDGTKPRLTANNNGTVVLTFYVDDESTMSHFLQLNPKLEAFADLNNHLYYVIGEIEDDTIVWNDVQVYGKYEGLSSGYMVDVSLNDHGEVIETHYSSDDLDDPNALYYRTGWVRDGEIDWSGPQMYYDTGRSPKVSLNNNRKVVTVHETEQSHFGNPMFSNTGQLVDIVTVEGFTEVPLLIDPNDDVPGSIFFPPGIGMVFENESLIPLAGGPSDGFTIEIEAKAESLDDSALFEAYSLNNQGGVSSEVAIGIVNGELSAGGYKVEAERLESLGVKDGEIFTLALTYENRLVGNRVESFSSLYVNGLPVVEDARTDARMPVTLDHIVIGTDKDSGMAFDGEIYSVYISNVARSSNEINLRAQGNMFADDKTTAYLNSDGEFETDLINQVLLHQTEQTSDNHITLSWDLLTGGQSEVVAYELVKTDLMDMSGPENDEVYRTFQAGSNAFQSRTFTDDDIKMGTVYVYTIRAITNGSDDVKASSQLVETSDLLTVSTRLNSALYEPKALGIKLDYTLPSDSGIDLDSFVIYRRNVLTGEELEFSVPFTALPDDHGLIDYDIDFNNVEYEYSIAVQDVAGNVSEKSNALTATTRIPAEIKAVRRPVGYAAIVEVNLSDEEILGQVFVEVERLNSTGKWVSESNEVLRDLTAYRYEDNRSGDYRVKLIVNDSEGVERYETPYMDFTLTGYSELLSENLRLSSVIYNPNTKSAIIAWYLPRNVQAYDGSDVEVVAIEIVRKNLKTNEVDIIKVTNAGLGYVDMDIDPSNVEYEYTIRVVDEYGTYSDYSNSIKITTY